MNHPMQTTIQHLFQVTALEDIPRERLESFVEEYPFFGYGHYLLSRKLRVENSSEFTGTTAKTSLYFSNPFWLEWLLENASETPEPVAGGRLTGTEKETEPESSMAESEERDIWSSQEMLLEVEAPAEEPTGSETPAVETDTPAADAETGAGSVEDQETEPSAALPSAAQQILNRIEEARILRESLIKINEDFHTPILPADEPIRDEEPPFVLEEQEQVTPPAEAPTPTPSPAPAVTAEPVLTFEPYHTIDYFASQGIRLSLDENPTDQLGKQLKSFTEWLKVMRRLPQKEKEIIPDRVAEQAIQSIAAHSIEGKEVLTETMAEVLAMQGMPERARIVYEKLSLLNPGKSAYFAAKIEQLNSR